MARIRALIGIVGCGLVVGSCGSESTAVESSLPVVEVTLGKPAEALFDAPKPGESKRWIKGRFVDVDGETRKAEVALRGFSDWHHGRAKPSIRVKVRGKKGKKGKSKPGPKTVELSRPEDPLAICNWLPDQLSAGLGLLHEHGQAVRLVLNGEDRGVYIRSLRPGNDLSDAAGRARGTFLKGDCLGDRRHFDLWQSSSSWSRLGEENPDAIVALNELLALLSEPPARRDLERLEAVFDLEKAACMQAVASLTASIHADRVHNHLLFYDVDARRLEPLLWDANSFGIHAEPELAVEVARHPLAERLLCYPEFLHRRNEVLWQLLHDAGRVDNLVAAVDRRLAELDGALRTDPEIARLVLRRGVFQVDAVGYEGLSDARADFVSFVERRAQHLTAWFADARVAVDAFPHDPGKSVVTVFGTVAVTLSFRNGASVRSIDGRDASLLWPGITATLVDERQHRAADGRGVAAPHGKPAPLRYVVECPVDQLVLRNAFTGTEVTPSAAPEDVTARSVHPWEEAVQTPATPR